MDDVYHELFSREVGGPFQLPLRLGVDLAYGPVQEEAIHDTVVALDGEEG